MNDITRRSLLGAIAATPALAVPAVAAATEHPLVAEMRAAREAANAKFWKLYEHFRALESAWEAKSDETEEEYERSAAAVHDAAVAVLMHGVFCPAAVLAKLQITHFDPAGYALPDPIHSADKVIEWDLERCAKEKLFN